MSEKISPGDLVCVVKACCDWQRNRIVGQTSVVPYIRITKTQCHGCKKLSTGLHAGAFEKSAGVPLSWLKKINPPPVEQSTPTKETICA